MPYAGSGAAALQTAVAWRAAEADRLVHDGQRSRNAASARRLPRRRSSPAEEPASADCAGAEGRKEAECERAVRNK